MLSIEHQQVRPNMVRITLKGRMMIGQDLQQVDTLVGGLIEVGFRDFVFDLAGLTHIDSTGIGRFIASYNRITAMPGASFGMAAAAGAVRSAFRVTRLDTVFPFFETVEQAQAAV
ncbi:MAG: STAS domain-containing protein [Acidobacteria bacterium]|nr:STAS domain-containing protein [Acidobacteriota bacterium]